jgi:hypothetical protein
MISLIRVNCFAKTKISAFRSWLVRSNLCLINNDDENEVSPIVAKKADN